MKTIICGGRDYQLTVDDFAWLDGLHAQHPVTEVVSGGAPGADTWGEHWAIIRRIPVRKFKAQWTQFGRAAGPRRNQEMAEYAEACIAFPGGSGTEDMLRRARGRGLTVYVRNTTPSFPA